MLLRCFYSFLSCGQNQVSCLPLISPFMLGTYNTLIIHQLTSAWDSFTQFRFSEERDWEMDPFAMSAVFVDLPTLAQTLQQVPLHQRLNLEAELLQCEEVKEVIKEKVEVEVKDKDVTPSKSASIKQEMTEEDLEDWLDSMIS
uniref:Apoptosis, caspase activation inhibitor n=1 Tax=Acanthochromis polyacanthus TaxID=80966 RepID=A0A3Q1FQZ8_9TELE